MFNIYWQQVDTQFGPRTVAIVTMHSNFSQDDVLRARKVVEELYLSGVVMAGLVVPDGAVICDHTMQTDGWHRHQSAD